MSPGHPIHRCGHAGRCPGAAHFPPRAADARFLRRANLSPLLPRAIHAIAQDRSPDAIEVRPRGELMRS